MRSVLMRLGAILAVVALSALLLGTRSVGSITRPIGETAPTSAPTIPERPAPAATQMLARRETQLPKPVSKSSATTASGQQKTQPVSNKKCGNDWASKLYTPTFIDRIGDKWLIVDCWHHRVIHSDDLDKPISEWGDLWEGAAAGLGSSRGQQPAMTIPHSFATDGNVIVVESSVGGSNGKNHTLMAYEVDKSSGGYSFVDSGVVSDQDAARRPHRVLYDSTLDAFVVYMTSPPTLTLFKWDNEARKLKRQFVAGLPFMGGIYARSIVIVNSSLYITAGPGAVWEVRVSLTGVQKVRPYSTKPLGFMKGKMNDLAYIDGWWYATATVPCSIVRFRSLAKMGAHEKLNGKLGMCKQVPRSATRCESGTPYFLSKVGDRIFVPYIFGCSGVVSFTTNTDQEITDVKHHWGGGWVEKPDDLCVRGKEW